ncbi:MAG: hypothetical protein P1V19_21955, partial [Gimesia sp.]|nr:hypothetical protein [Gimesia sp.]
MNRNSVQILLMITILLACNLSIGTHKVFAAPPPQNDTPNKNTTVKRTVKATATKKQEAEIRALIEQLVYIKPKKQKGKNSKASDEQTIEEEEEERKAQRKQYDVIYKAFNKLYEFKVIAFPILIEHLDDKRGSIHFRNHDLGHSVGNACHWIIYYQLRDRPKGYSRYGYSRKGRDGKNHAKPDWSGSPFDEAGGLRKWLIANKDLSYTEQQIKCLTWFLEKEKKIGAPDADSYFLNILPLEIRILERQLELGKDVKAELKRLRQRQAQKEIEEIPAELLP